MTEAERSEESIALRDYAPRSMLTVHRSEIRQPCFPVIDFHTHLTWSRGLNPGEEITIIAGPDELLPVMDAKNVRVMVNLTGGYGHGLIDALQAHTAAHPNRFVVFTEPWWSRVTEAGYRQFQVEQIQ